MKGGKGKGCRNNCHVHPCMLYEESADVADDEDEDAVFEEEEEEEEE